MKTLLTTLISSAILLATSSSWAHSPMETTIPIDKAQLETVPGRLQMNFKSPARILKVVMTHSLDGTSRETRLDLPTRKAIKKIEFTPEFMGAGEYKIEWRALGTDGHVIKGDFSFEVSG